MDKDSDQRTILVLKTIREAELPVGASWLSRKLSIPSATIGRILSDLDKKGFLTKVSNKGRILTEKGNSFLKQAEYAEEKEATARELADFVTESDKSVLLEILQVRKLLEVYAAGEAAIHATDEEIQELEQLMLEHLHEIRSGSLGSDTDFQIHLAIARVSGVQTIQQILKIILTTDNVYTKFSYVSDHLKHTQIKQHDEIIEAIRAHDREQARSAMEHHLNQIIDDVKRYYNSDSGR